MKKEGLPGSGIFLIGLFVALASFFLGAKFFFFLLAGIAFCGYGLAKLYIFKDKLPERFSSKEHREHLSLHGAKHAAQQSMKSCHYCTQLLPLKARLCIYCGSKV